MADSYNAFLRYTTPKGKTLQYNMWVMEYSQPHQVSGNSSQARMYKHFYPKSYSPGDIAVTGRVRTQLDYNNLARYIRGHHEAMMAVPGGSNLSSGSILPLIKLFITAEGINVDGFVKSFQAGAKRFNVAPEFQFSFTVIKDAHSKNTDMRAGYAVRQLWTGSFINEGSINFQSLDPTTPTPSAPSVLINPKGALGAKEIANDPTIGPTFDGPGQGG